jgi:hypothetical protein
LTTQWKSEAITRAAHDRNNGRASWSHALLMVVEESCAGFLMQAAHGFPIEACHLEGVPVNMNRILDKTITIALTFLQRYRI